MTGTTPTNSPRRRRSHRWIAVTLLAALAVLFPAFGAWLYLLHDGPPPDDADLLVEVPIVRPEENGYLLLRNSVLNVLWPYSFNFHPSDEGYEQLSAALKADIASGVTEGGDGSTNESLDPAGALDRMLRGDEWFPSFARKVFELEAAYLERTEESLMLPRFQFYEEDPQDYFNFIRFVQNYLLLRAQNLSRQGRLDEALDEAMKLVRLAGKIRSSARNILHLLDAITTEQQGFKAVQDLLARDELSKDAWRRLHDELLVEGDEQEATCRAILGWYGVFVRFIEHPYWFGPLGSYADLDGQIPSPWNSWSFLLSNSSRALAAESARNSCGNAGKPVKDWTPLVDPAYVYEGWGRLIPVRNGMGRRVVVCWSSFMRVAESKGCFVRVQRRLMVAWLALKLHHADRGDFPADLDSLVPQYLQNVPIDPYDGKPLRFSTEKKIIYSIGDDLTDSGGSSETEINKAFQDAREPTLHLELPKR